MGSALFLSTIQIGTIADGGSAPLEKQCAGGANNGNSCQVNEDCPGGACASAICHGFCSVQRRPVSDQHGLSGRAAACATPARCSTCPARGRPRRPSAARMRSAAVAVRRRVSTAYRARRRPADVTGSGEDPPADDGDEPRRVGWVRGSEPGAAVGAQVVLPERVANHELHHFVLGDPVQLRLAVEHDPERSRRAADDGAPRLSTASRATRPSPRFSSHVESPMALPRAKRGRAVTA